MIRTPAHIRNPKRGSAIVMSMVLTLITAGIAFAVLSYATHSLDLTKRALDYQRARAAAEAGLEYGRSELLEILRTYEFSLSTSALQAQLSALNPPPAFTNYQYQSPGGSASFRVTVNGSATTGTVVLGMAAAGSEGIHQLFTITCGASMPGTGVGAVVEEQVQAVSVHMNRFGVFYQEDLEIDPGPQMYFHGPVHANGDLYIDGPIDCLDRVTSHQDIIHGRKDTGTVAGDVNIENDSGTLVSMMDGATPVDSGNPNWMTESLTRWEGRVLDGAHAVPNLAPPYNPLDDAHDIIEPALPTNHPSYRADTEAGKFHNNAALHIHVSTSGTFTATDYFGTDVTASFTPAVIAQDGTNSYGGTPLDRKTGGQYDFATAGTYDTSRTFYDGRESVTVDPLDIYVDQLMAQFPQLTVGATYGTSEGRGVVYVTRDDPDGAGGVMPAVRIRNGDELPAGGITFASDLPMYVEGPYNTENTAKPAMVAGDAVTLLSADWQDVRSTGPLDDRIPADTVYNAVVMTGNYATVPGSYYNGGLENVLRFLEDWDGVTVTFRGSIIDLWFSETAAGLWGSGYYVPPYRDWGYDNLYRTTSPPGAPRVFAVEQLSWAQTTWADEGW